HYLDKPKKEDTEMVYLVEKEIQEIIQTDFFDLEMKNAFLFGCYTGLRFSDIRALKWENIKDDVIQITQTKTKANVYIPLNFNALKILSKQNKDRENIFILSNHNGSANRTLRKMIAKTSITKHVSFHSSR